MPPRAKALTSAVEVFAAPTIRRSSRRSIQTPSTSTQPAASKSTNATEASAPVAAKGKRPRVKAESGPEALSSPAQASPRARGKRAIKIEADTSPVKEKDADGDPTDVKPAATKKRRTKKEIEEENEVFPSRPSPHHALVNGHHGGRDRRGSGLFIGAHISSAGGVENAPLNALRIGGNAFSCFVRPKMQWASNPISDTSTLQFKQRVQAHGFIASPETIQQEDGVKTEPTENDHMAEEHGFVVPHGCYLVNLANPELAKREKSFEAFIDDLQRCEQLGVRLFNFHPGSMTAASALNDDTANSAPLSAPRTDVRAAKQDACALVASYINRAHALTSSVVVLIENMAGSKNDTILGSSLHDLAHIISHVEDKSRVGVCIDTCHAFAAGYDLTTPATYAAFVSEIESTIGWERVRAMHLNDSKFALGCKRDRHENIGRGCIGLGGFWSVVNDERWNGIPLILETPALGNAVAAYVAKEGTKKMHEVWSYQIQALYALRGTKWGEWKEAEDWLSRVDKVVAEAEKLHASKKKSKGEDVKNKAKPKGKKKLTREEDSDLSSDDEQ